MNNKMYLIVSLLMVNGALFGADAAREKALTEQDIIDSRIKRGHDGKPVDALVLENLGLSGTLPEVLGGRTLATIVQFESPLETRVISFQHNKVTGEVPADFVKDCHKVEVLNLSHNEITGVQPGAFNIANSLQWVVLRNNKITKLDKDAVKRVMGLWGLILENNRIEDLDSEAFKNLRFLHVLDLSNNRIKTLKSGQFAHIRVIDEARDAVNAGGERPYPNTLDGYPKGDNEALEINLSGNPIETVELGAFRNLPHLKTLTVKNEPPLSEDLQARIMSMVPVDCKCSF